MNHTDLMRHISNKNDGSYRSYAMNFEVAAALQKATKSTPTVSWLSKRGNTRMTRRSWIPWKERAAMVYRMLAAIRFRRNGSMPFLRQSIH